MHGWWFSFGFARPMITVTRSNLRALVSLVRTLRPRPATAHYGNGMCSEANNVEKSVGRRLISVCRK
jgi:hypothetical protein